SSSRAPTNRDRASPVAAGAAWPRPPLRGYRSQLPPPSRAGWNRGVSWGRSPNRRQSSDEFLILVPGSGEQVFQGVLGQRVWLLLGPVRGLRCLLIALGLDLGRGLGRDPSPLDEPADEPRDRLVPRRFLDLLLGPVPQMVVFRRVRVDAPDLGVDQSRSF